MRVLVAAIQARSEPLDVPGNLHRVDGLLQQAHESGVEIAVLPEMCNTGYSICPDYGPYGEAIDGPTLTHWRARAKQWKMCIAGGFVEREGRHLFDAIAFVTPEGETSVYRKRNLVFWERFKFRPGRASLTVATKFGRIGFAICADMIFRKTWEEYRDCIDLAIISAAWPDFKCRHTGRKDWLLGHVGPLSGAIPGKVAKDLGIPVIFANQCGETHTFIPILRTRIADRFAGLSSITDGLHGAPNVAGLGQELLLAPITIHPKRGLKTWVTMSPSVPAA